MQTSVMLTLALDNVDMTRAEPGGPYRETGWRRSGMLQGRPYYIVNEFDEISECGTVGLPEYASAEQGEEFLAGSRRFDWGVPGRTDDVDVSGVASGAARLLTLRRRG
jgi:hypothetical protein